MTQENDFYALSPEKMKEIMQEHNIEGLEEFYTQACLKSSVLQDLFIGCSSLKLISAEGADPSVQNYFRIKFSNLLLVSWYLYRHGPVAPILDLDGIPKYLSAYYTRNVGRSLLQSDQYDRRKINQRFTKIAKDSGATISKRLWFWIYPPFAGYPKDPLRENNSFVQRFATFCLHTNGIRIQRSTS